MKRGGNVNALNKSNDVGETYMNKSEHVNIVRAGWLLKSQVTTGNNVSFSNGITFLNHLVPERFYLLSANY